MDNSHVLTVDVEEWFHATALETVVDTRPRDSWPSRVEASTHRLLDLFEEADARGTFFVLGCLAERYPALVRRIAESGHEVATHGYDHTLLTRLTPATFKTAMTRAVGVLEDITGARALGHRGPSYSLTREVEWVFDVLLGLGIQYDSSVRRGPGRLSVPYWITTPAGARIREYPMTFVRVFDTELPLAAGGYFRLYPYKLTRALLRRFQSSRIPANVCVHPWDIDVAQPRLAGISALSRFRHYVNLATTEAKLRQLLRDFRFIPMIEALR
jgi:polysaccharide deacetylase family protein (PEP-CTERM system associated)